MNVSTWNSAKEGLGFRLCISLSLSHSLTSASSQWVQSFPSPYTLYLQYYPLISSCFLSLLRQVDKHTSTAELSVWSLRDDSDDKWQVCQDKYGLMQDEHKGLATTQRLERGVARAGYQTSILLWHRTKCFSSTEYQNMPKFFGAKFWYPKGLITWSRSDNTTVIGYKVTRGYSMKCCQRIQHLFRAL